MEDFVIKDSELGTLSDQDSLILLQANFPLLQIFIQVSNLMCFNGFCELKYHGKLFENLKRYDS
jgi:hypothetical protein